MTNRFSESTAAMNRDPIRASRPWRGLAVVSLALGALACEPLPEDSEPLPEDREPEDMEPEEMEIVDGHEAKAGQVIVRFREPPVMASKARGTALAADTAFADVMFLAESVAARPIGDGGLGLYLIHSHRDTASVLQELDGHPELLYAEPNYILRLTATPNDPHVGKLYGLHNTGQTVQGQVGIADADIDAVEAWDFSTGSSSVVVGVVDTGIRYDHPDLAANAWSAPSSFTVDLGGESITCPAGSHGFNAITNSCDPADDHGHGTHCAGTIGARGNNGAGVAGVNWTTSIMGLKFLGFGGSGTLEDAINAIEFAIQAKQQGKANVRVLSNSWGGGPFTESLRDVIDRANDNDILFVAAAGNANNDNDATPTYPASYDTPNMVAVAATDNRDAKASFSSYGANTVHLGAPGVNVVSTFWIAGTVCEPVFGCQSGNGYQYLSGTSMATPHVAGAAALMLSVCPGLDTAGLRTTILDQVDPVPSLAGITETGGRLNAHKAIRACSGPFYVSASPGFRSVGRTKTTTYAVTVGVNGGFAGAVNLGASGLPSGATASFSPASVTGGGTSTLSVTAGASTPLGTSALTIKGTSPTSSHQSSSTVSLEVALPDFRLSAGPSDRLVVPGTSTTYSVSLEGKGSFASVVSLSVSGLPGGTSRSFSPSSLIPSGTSTLTITPSAATPDGIYTLTITGTGGGLTRSQSATMEVLKPSFTMPVTPASVTVTRHPVLVGTAVYSTSITPNRTFAGTINFSVSGLPASGVTVTNLGPITVNPGFSYTKLFIVRVQGTAPAGTFPLTWTGTGLGATKSATTTLIIK